jgi:hypothetical protein
MASISASSGGWRRAGARRGGGSSGTVSGASVPASPSAGSMRSPSAAVDGVSGSACRGAAPRVFHQACSASADNTSALRIASAVVSVISGRGSQAASAIDKADSISTATIRLTPCSCIVTPISCCAISIAILLWLMKRNCVPLLISVTSLR